MPALFLSVDAPARNLTCPYRSVKGCFDAGGVLKRTESLELNR
jgi:hypothetical protein